jgi:hypothetical protein
MQNHPSEFGDLFEQERANELAKKYDEFALCRVLLDIGL